MHSFVDRRNLGEQINAVGVVFDHALDATNLALDAGQTFEVILFGRGIADRTVIGMNCHDFHLAPICAITSFIYTYGVCVKRWYGTAAGAQVFMAAGTLD